MATWIGWRLHGWPGGLAAGLLFVAPGALVILGPSILYAFAADLDWFAALFLGVKAAVLAIVAQALFRIAGRALDTRFKQALALAAFIALFFFDLPFPMIVLGAGALGIIAAAVRPDWLALKQTNSEEVLAPRPWRDTLGSAALWGAVWAAPLLLVLFLFGSESVFWDIGVFFSQLAIVTFGGAYAVLAYMAQEAVQGFGWLQPGEMADGLGMAKTTPGPLNMVTQFVGFLAAFRDPGPFSPIVAGLIGARLTTWVTFAPCFLWIFSFAPWIDRLRNAVKLKGGLAALTAAVVGVIANRAVWFALHVLFVNVGETQAGPVRLYTPEWITFDWRAGDLAVLAGALVFVANWSVVRVLGVAALGGLVQGLSA